jgi:hypothetical protein
LNVPLRRGPYGSQWPARSVRARPTFGTISQLNANTPLLAHAPFARAVLIARGFVGITARFGPRFVAGTTPGFRPAVTVSTTLAFSFGTTIAASIAIGITASRFITDGIVTSIIAQLTNSVSQPAKPLTQCFACCGELLVIEPAVIVSVERPHDARNWAARGIALHFFT